MKMTIRRGFAAIVLLTPLAACSNPADKVTEAEVTDVPAMKAATQAASQDAQRYEIAPGSTISFVGSKVTGRHGGGFRRFDGSFTFDGKGLVGSDNRIVIDMGSTWADNEKLAGHLKSADFFDVNKYPTSTFEFAEIQKTADSGYMVIGKLTFHGVTKQISFPVQFAHSGDSGRVTSEFFIKRFDFGIKYPGKADDLIRDEVVIKLEIKLKRA